MKDFKKSLGTKKQVTSSKSSVPCPHCKEMFSNNYSLKRHLTGKHPSINSSSIQHGNCMCLEHHCGYKCRQILELREHLIKRHGLNAISEQLEFTTRNEFEDWKLDYEENLRC